MQELADVETGAQPGMWRLLHDKRVLELRRRKFRFLWKRKAEHEFLNQQVQLLSTASVVTPC